MTARAPNYRLNKAVDRLEAGSFVRPVEDRYLSEHHKKDMEQIRKSYGHEVVLCYTRIGWVLVPRDALEET